MPRLIHLNGPTGVGKSTLAARYAADHPLTLNLDADEIVRLVGGWQADFYGAVDLVRPLALSMAATHLAAGHDVVMPQLIMRHSERDRFAAAATSAGADYVEFVLRAPVEVAVERYRERTHHIDHVVEALGGERVIHESHGRIEAYLTAGTEVIEASGGAEQTYADLLTAMNRSARPR
ncbi:AAA family ATPase [Lentzea sp. NPDC058450]|uniref:AAA family ATPase n=1 Tax=Lentzea sp. NPDC058450 TaxID=3346505 RepID=UPI003666A8D3